MKTLFFFLMLIITSQASAKFVVLANYELDEIEIDCFSQIPQVFLFTRNAGEMNIQLDSLKICYKYSTVARKEFFDCDPIKGLNRFIVHESDKTIEHSFELNSILNCNKKKKMQIHDFFLTRDFL